MTPSEEIIDRYRKIERRSDALGRIIGVKRLKLSQQLRVEEMAPSEGKTMLPVLAASVVEIDDHKIPFPKNRGELDAIMDRLDAEGLAAAAEGWRAVMGLDDASPDDEETEAKDEVSVAKKIAGDPWLKSKLILLDHGFPFDVVDCLSVSELLAYSISVQELQTGNQFDWKRMMWVEKS